MNHRNPTAAPRELKPWQILWPLLLACALVITCIAIYLHIGASGFPNPLASSTTEAAAILDIAVLVFREGLECVLVLAAITASFSQERRSCRTPIFAGVASGLVATLLTWCISVRILSDLSQSISALALQAATGLLAVLVLLVVMNWFFHKFYWTGWISFHNNRKRELFESAANRETTKLAFFWGMAFLGFTSVYREGFEVVLFLQSYRLRLGDSPISWGVSIAVVLSVVVAFLTLLAHRRLPYRKMLVLTGLLLGIVLIVMVGEQAQEMQLAQWIPTTQIPALHFLPSWMGLWFSVFPTVETLMAQAVAALLVLGSYFAVSPHAITRQRGSIRPRSQASLTPSATQLDGVWRVARSSSDGGTARQGK